MSRHRTRPLPSHAPDELPVTFRYRPEGPVSFLDLRGDLAHWSHIESMAPARDGWFETTLRLGPGAYGYKFQLSGSGDWRLDAQNPRTRARDGVRNSLLVVGGADEPVLHVPARPWVFLEDDGRLCLRAGLRRGAGERLGIRWDEGDGPRQGSLALVAAEDEHLLFEVHLPASARSLEYAFVLEDGRTVGRPGGAGQAFRIALSALRSTVPAWWRDTTLYTLFVDRFRRGGHGGAWAGPLAGDQALAGGDLDGVVEALPYLADLGVGAIHLTPIVVAGSAHRYDAIDPRRVDPALGGEAALGRLLEEAHRRELRILLDLTVTHVHRDFFAFQDVRSRGRLSPYWGWFRAHRYPFHEGHDPGYAHYQKGQWREPLLETGEPEVIDYLAGTFERWARFGADGFRVDAAADVPLGLLRRVAAAARAVSPEIVLFGEMIPENLHRVTAAGLDAATDFPAQEALYDWIWRRRTGTGAGAGEMGAKAAWRRFDRGGPGYTAVAFTATHDQHRLLTLTGDVRATRLGHLRVLLGAALPAIYYGDEVGLKGAGSPSRDFEDAWPDRCPMAWGEEASWDGETLALFREALSLRRSRLALRRGDETFLAATTASGEAADEILVFRRAFADEIIDVLLHAGDGEREIALPGGAASGAELLLHVGEVSIDPEKGSLRLGPFSAAVLARIPPPSATAMLREIAGNGRLLAGLAFREGLVESPALPVNLYLTVTELCNLRCRHCITEAPAKTAEGRARTLQPWLLDALREVFAAADYIAFVHGGEALSAPVFPEVLQAIQAARAGRPGRADVHLLTNGMLLDAERTGRLLDLGVTSLSVSLDGATTATNDAIRLGGRFPTIVHNLREAARIRAQRGADLRLGVSTVLTTSNLAELPALGRLVADLGLDWLKVEELYPCTPMARHELLLPREPRVEQAMAELRQALAKSGVVLVDHRDPPAGCGCEAVQKPEIAAFRAADDFANRAVFHPCRMEWEQACVDPDGTVRPVDYGREPLGNLLEASFLDLWNGEAARRMRKEALARTPAGRRRGCPIGR